MNIVLPSEIINIIFEFNPEHRPLLGECLKRVENYKLLKEIPLEGSLSRYRYLLNKFDDKVLHSGEKMDMEALVRKHINDPNVFIKITTNVSVVRDIKEGDLEVCMINHLYLNQIHQENPVIWRLVIVHVGIIHDLYIEHSII